ncbi:MAG: hypothetical protein M3122_03945 [Actinomycetota bacterium]|nr:hypothetical protein [Actinomycetota bacterium]
MPDLARQCQGRVFPQHRPLVGLPSDQTARNAIKGFNNGGLEQALTQGSRRPHAVNAAFHAGRTRELKQMLRQSPRDFGKPSSLRTLEMAAEMSFEKGLTKKRVSGETIRATLTLARMGVRWLEPQALDHQSPDPEYARNQGVATD